MSKRAVAAMLWSCAGCGPEAPEGTGGTDVEGDVCGRGLVVASSDYQSTNVSFVAWDGAILSSSVVSSASADPGLSAALSGDVTLPTARQDGGAIVIIDRLSSGVLTYVDVQSGSVDAQIDVRTGFSSNPQDYLDLGDGRALVARYDPDPNPGDAPFDGGSDLLVVDTALHEIVDRIDLHGALEDGSDLFPRPARLLANADHVFVLLSVYGQSFFDSGISRLAVLDRETLSLVETVVLDYQGCAGFVFSPSGADIAIACSGAFSGGAVPDIESAGVVIVDLDSLAVANVIHASSLGEAPPGFSVAYLDADHLLVPTFGQEASSGDSARPDVLWRIPTQGEAPTPLLDGPAFTLGEVRCACEVCVVADAERGLVRFVSSNDSAGEVIGDPAPAIGLPPRYLGGF